MTSAEIQAGVAREHMRRLAVVTKAVQRAGARLHNVAIQADNTAAWRDEQRQRACEDLRDAMDAAASLCNDIEDA